MFGNKIDNDTLARYQEISSDLIGKIRSSEFPEGELLPSENDLIIIYNTSRTTIRRALEVLDRDGYISKRQGKGSIVLPLKYKNFSHIPASGILRGLQDNDFGLKEYERIHIRCELVPSPSDIAKKFHIAEGAPVLLYERIYTINSLPYIFSTSYLNNHFFKGIEQYDFKRYSLSSTIFSFGLHLVITNRRVRAVEAENIAQHLNIKENKPLLLESYDCIASTHTDDVIVEVANCYFNTDIKSVLLYNK